MKTANHQSCLREMNEPADFHFTHDSGHTTWLASPLTGHSQTARSKIIPPRMHFYPQSRALFRGWRK
jgi:hypothetical protein